MTGSTISHYRILEKIGEGGMGVVYKAEDTRLKRQVALKFLPQALLTGEEERKRFVREAQSAAALTNPNIATVYSIDEADNQTFIVLEYVEGQSLDSKIASGPLKIREAITIATQICEGLRAAHEKGVVHRDIKSANIMVTEKGQVKILDFGLAKLKGVSRITKVGITAGTLVYMSPEQVSGEAIDERTDIWALGVVLYEMIAGRLPFNAQYEQALVYQILNEAPEPLTSIRTGVPMEIERIVSKMLAKSPGDRYQHVEEIPIDLRNVRSQTEPKVAVPTQEVVPSSRSSRKWLWALGGLVIGAILAIGVFNIFHPLAGFTNSQPDVQRFSLIVPDSTPIAPIGAAPLGIGQPSIAVSHDGSLVVFVGQIKFGCALFLRPMNRYESTRLQGTDGAYHPFFSPSGRWIGFFVGNQMKKISVDGGAVTTLCEVINPRGAVWTEDDRILFSDREGARLRWVESGGGVPTEFVSVSGSRFGAFDYPTVLPGGRSILCGRHAELVVVSLVDGSAKPLNLQGTTPLYMKNGHVVFYSNGSLLAAPFDPERQEISGTPLPVANGILAEAPHFGAHYSVSENGTFVYIPGFSEVDARLVMVQRDGKRDFLPFPPALCGTFQISPDGRRLAILTRVVGFDLWIYDLRQGFRTRVTTDGRSGYPIWSPDGKWILYNSGAGEQRTLVRELADGSGKKEVLAQAGTGAPYSLSPNGRYLAVSDLDSTTLNDVKVIDLSGRDSPVRIAGTSANEWGPAFSPDGKYIAYVSDEPGQYEIYVQPFPADGRRWQISTEGGEEPIWSNAGKELLYRRGQEWVSVEVATNGGFSSGKSTVALTGNYVNVGGRSYDVTPDGKRFLLLERLDANVRLTEIRVVTNWFHEVSKKLQGR